MFVCIENNQVISMLDYAPTVPSSVEVVKISSNDYKKIMNKTHFFDVGSKSVKEVPSVYSYEVEQKKLNLTHQNLLDSTDWKVLRHIRERTLGVPTTLTEEEYIKLEKQRHAAAKAIR